MLPRILCNNLLRSGTLTANGTAAGYSLDSIIDFKTFTKWRSDVSTDSYIQIEFTSPQSPNCLGIFNHNFDSLSGTIKLQYFDSTWIDLQTITPNGTLALFFTFTAQAASKFRIFFDDPTIAPEMAVMFLGIYIEFPFPPIAPTVPATESISVATEFSEAGHTLGSVISHFPITINHRWENITRTWFDTYFKPFWINHARYLIPFFYAWDLTNRPLDIFYVTVDGSQRFGESLTILSVTDQIELNMKGISSDANYSPLNES